MRRRFSNNVNFPDTVNYICETDQIGIYLVSEDGENFYKVEFRMPDNIIPIKFIAFDSGEWIVFGQSGNNTYRSIYSNGLLEPPTLTVFTAGTFVDAIAVGNYVYASCWVGDVCELYRIEKEGLYSFTVTSSEYELKLFKKFITPYGTNNADISYLVRNRDLGITYNQVYFNSNNPTDRIEGSGWGASWISYENIIDTFFVGEKNKAFYLTDQDEIFTSLSSDIIGRPQDYESSVSSISGNYDSKGKYEYEILFYIDKSSKYIYSIQAETNLNLGRWSYASYIPNDLMWDPITEECFVVGNNGFIARGIATQYTILNNVPNVNITKIITRR